jgi:hypothetical protein
MPGLGEDLKKFMNGILTAQNKLQDVSVQLSLYEDQPRAAT